MARRERTRVTAGGVVAAAAIGLGGLVTAVTVAGGVIAVIFARTVVTPPKRREEDVHILAHDATTITLSATLDSMTPGQYSLWFARDAGHARVGEIISYTTHAVTRELLAVTRGSLDGATRGRLSGWFYLSPDDLGYPYSDVEVATELGAAPAWLIPAEDDGSSTNRWLIGVHGRAVRREETLRAVPVFREAGYTSLLVSYRNDGDAPGTADNRYSLGDTEWKDVEAAIQFAIDSGAESVVLMGWSMGGATVLQALTRSPLAVVVTGVVLESPVVDWVTALHYQGVAHKLPRVVRLGILNLLSSRWSTFLTGQGAPIDLRRLDIVRNAAALHTPILLLHSDDDGFVPATASRALAMERPDIVTFESFTTARHTKLWNYDAFRWNGAISRWLRQLG